ncbi:MAG: hypothetical protein AABY87_07705 [bacterium]
MGAFRSASGSDSPPSLLSAMGIDVNDPGSWQKGYDLIMELKKTLGE